MVAVILLSSAALIFEEAPPSPDLVQQDLVRREVLDRLDQVLAYLFVVEMLLKWTAFGFRKYFSSFWCWLDFLILDVSLVGLAVGALGGSAQTLRALRTLRVPSRFRGTRALLRRLALALPSLLRVLLVVAFVWLLFGIGGIHMFAGRFSHCFNETSEEYFARYNVANQSQCLELESAEVRWKNTPFHFDNIWMSFLSLFMMTTTAGWLEVVYSAVDSTGVGVQPEFEANPYSWLFFILFMVVSGFLTWNLFIRFFVDALQNQNQSGREPVFMTEQQQQNSRSLARRLFSPDEAPPTPQGPLSRLVGGRPLQLGVALLVGVQAGALMVESEGQSEDRLWALSQLHLVVFLLYGLELLLRLAALRRQFFHSALNNLDLAVLVLFIPGFFLYDLWVYHLFNPVLVGLLRIGRVVQVLRLCRCARPIRTLISGFVASYPALLNVGLLLLLLLHTYAFLGMCAFAHLEGKDDDILSFGTFGSSVLTLLMVSPSFHWEGPLHRVLDARCHPDCSSPAAPILFFTSYVLLQALLLPALFLAVIVELFPGRELPDAPPLEEERAVTAQEASGPGGSLQRRRQEAAAVIQRAFRSRRPPSGGGASSARTPDGGGAL